MSKKIILPLLVVFSLGAAAGAIGCQASANVGTTEPKSAPPPEPAPPTPPPAPTPEVAAAPPPKKVIKSMGKAKIENNEIKIPGKVHFEVDKAAIKEDKETVEILQTVADVMKENPAITKLRIEGHTDDSGSADHNNKLSQGRADAVVAWLEKKGVEKTRLDSKGWGPARPMVKNDTKENKEQNRRVEFKLWELEGKQTDTAKADETAGAGTATASTAPAGDKKDAKPTATTPAAKKP